jgi:hypothetical protein
MDVTRSVQVVSSVGAEPASFPSQKLPPSGLPKKVCWTCCVPVDLPGVGLVHAPGCPDVGLSDVLSNFGAQEAMLPHSLGSQLLDGLLARLLFAARDLAGKSINSYCLNPGPRRVCMECGAIASPTENLVHREHCKTGRVLDILDEILHDRLPANESTKKEDASAEETRADEGVRLGADGVFRCLKCGVTDSAWVVEPILEGVYPPMLDSNQLLRYMNQSQSADGIRKLSLLTHLCEGGAR